MIMDRFGPESLIYPVFVKERIKGREEIQSMPGIFRHSPESAVEEAARALEARIGGVLVFGASARRDAKGSGAYEKGNVVSGAVSLLKGRLPGLTVMTDVCLCAYTASGHCAVLDGCGEKARELRIDRESTLEALGRAALSHAAAGADYVAPSAMAEGQVRHIRSVLDNSGHSGVKIMGYSAKFDSAFYGPFRDAAGSAPRFGDRSGYQIDPSAGKRALREIETDISEGADIVMVKPALAYLDIIRAARDRFSMPLAAYSVSGEYSMIKAAARAEYLNEKRAVYETMAAVRRAGADTLITYHAADIARWLRMEADKDEELRILQ